MFIFAFLFAVEVQLLVSQKTIEKHKPLWVALTYTIPANSHVYGNFPGSSGLASTIDLKLPKNLKLIKYHWPITHKYLLDNKTYYVYKDHFTVLAQLEVLEDSKDAPIEVFLEHLMCSSNVCVPETKDLRVNIQELPVFSIEDFEKWNALIPSTEFRGTIEAFHQGKVLLLHLRPEAKEIQSLDFFAHDDELFENIEQVDWSLIPGGYCLTIYLKTPWVENQKLKGIISINQNQGALIDIETKPYKPWWHDVWFPLLMAFLGGLLLNIMPCVLPVLSIKVLSMFSKQKNVRKEAFLYSCGVISTFLNLGALLIVFRALGLQMGWGFQLQSPQVIYGLTVVFLLIGLNFLGFFEMGTFMMRYGNMRTINFTSYFNGVLSTIVATPCTAPFMGIALSYALFQPTFIVLLIFFFLGLGMSLPILLLGFSEKLLLPAPGPWMIKMKQLMAFFIFATCVWLLQILGELTGVDTTFMVLYVLIFIALFMWISQYFYKIPMMLLSLVPLGYGYHQIELSSSPNLNYESYEEERFLELIDKGKTVLLYFTAKWCLTCQINGKILASKSVVQKLKDKDVQVIYVDWTTRSEAVTKLLHRFGKQSIPATILIKQNKDVIMFNEILTVNGLNSVIDQL